MRLAFSCLMRRMSSIFTSTISPTTGKSEWLVQREDYDYEQELARSGFADMLHDEQRNRLYEQALKSVIERMKSNGTFVHCLDIGTGTGLLSLMAARIGADRVTAIEAFEPMAKVASRVIETNRNDDKIRLVIGRSTDLEDVVASSDRANLLVAEVFDTELIGEGALRTFKEALERLAQHDARVIPASARIWALPIESDLISQWTRAPKSTRIRHPASCRDCSGAASVHDLQFDQIPRDSFKALCKPLLAFTFDFQDVDSIEYNENINVEFVVSHEFGTGKIDAILVWWDLNMDGTDRDETRLSMAPTSIQGLNVPWRDHWMQAIYYLPRPLETQSGTSLILNCGHDEYSLWFDVGHSRSLTERPVCTCNLHVICSRSNFGRMNDRTRFELFSRLFDRMTPNTKILVINDGSMMSLWTAVSNTTFKVTSIEPNRHFRSILNQYSIENSIDNLELVEDIDSIPMDNTADLVVLSEPFFFSSSLPWHNLRLWYTIDELKRKRPNVRVSVQPNIGILRALPVSLDHLWKIRAPTKSISGFDLTPFNDVIQRSIRKVDALIEPQPMWEYPSISTASVVDLLQFIIDIPIPMESINTNEQFIIEKSGTNAVIFWMEWKFGESILSDGLQQPCLPGSKPIWDRYSKQGVYFLPESQRIDDNFKKIVIKTKFQTTSGEIKFDFEFQ